MQFLESMSQPSSMLEFPTSNKGSKQKSLVATQTKSKAETKPNSSTETKSPVSKASFESTNPATTKPLQDENQAMSLLPKAETPPAAAPTPTQALSPQPADTTEPGLSDSSEIPKSMEMPDRPQSMSRWPKSSRETPCDTGPDTSTNISLPSVAFTSSTVPDPNCEPGGFASLSIGMNPQFPGRSYLNGSEFRRDPRTGTEIAIQLKQQNKKLMLEKEYLKDTAETLKIQLTTEQAARKLAQTKFDEIQIENKDQRKVIAQLQLAYENLATQKIEVEKTYDKKLREIESTLDKALLEAMYDSNKK
jgi:hypothetical protein